MSNTVNFAPLIRLAKQKLDERRREVVQLQSAADRIRNQIGALDQQVATERAAAQKTLEDGSTLGFGFGRYAKILKDKARLLDVSLQQMEARVAHARTAMTAAFQELKKYELAAEAQAEALKAKFARAEAERMDEVAIAGFMRAQNDY